ncbi:MAG: oligosaccharide flippase family protein [Pseudomonadota bacterium]
MRAIFKALGATFSGALITLVCHFFTLMFLARILEQEVMGLYFIAVMVTFLLKLLSDLGVDLAFVKKYPEESESGRNSLLRSAIGIRIVSCVGVSLLYWSVEASGIVSFINLIADVTLLTLTLYWMHSFRELILRLLQAEQRFSVYAGTQVLAALLKAVLVVGLLALSDVTLKHVLFIEIIAFLASITYAATRVRERLMAALRSSFQGGREILRFGYPLYLNALLNLGNERVSQYIVAGLGGPLVMALFGVAERLADAGTRLFESFVNVYYPAQTKHFADNNPAEATTFANRSLLWICFIIGSGIIAFATIREPVIQLFFSAKYVSVADAATMFFAVLLLRSLQTLMGYFGVAAGQKFLPVKVSLVSSIFNIIACYLLFLRYGYEGAIAALVFTQLLMNCLYFYWLKRAGYELNITPIVLMLLLTLGATATIFYLSDHLLLSMLVFPAYILACFVTLPELRTDSAIGWNKLTDYLQARSIKADNAH